MSLRARLLIGLVALVAAGLAIAAIVTYAEQRSFLLTRVDQQVLSALGPVSTELRARSAPRRRRRPPDAPRGLFGGAAARAGAGARRSCRRGRSASCRSPNGPGRCAGGRSATTGSRARRRALPAALPPSARAGGLAAAVHRAGQRDRPSELPCGRRSDRARTRPSSPCPLREADRTLHRLVIVEALVGGGVILALVALGWLVIRLGLRPLERIGRVAGEIAGGDLRAASARPTRAPRSGGSASR